MSDRGWWESSMGIEGCATTVRGSSDDGTQEKRPRDEGETIAGVGDTNEDGGSRDEGAWVELAWRSGETAVMPRRSESGRLSPLSEAGTRNLARPWAAA
jgi:hypothetical protein